MEAPWETTLTMMCETRREVRRDIRRRRGKESAYKWNSESGALDPRRKRTVGETRREGETKGGKRSLRAMCETAEERGEKDEKAENERSITEGGKKEFCEPCVRPWQRRKGGR